MRWWPLIAALGARALRPNLDLGLTARALAAYFRDCRGESCSVDVLDGFAGAAVAAFRNAYSLDVLLMELDLADDERLPREDRARRAEISGRGANLMEDLVKEQRSEKRGASREDD